MTDTRGDDHRDHDHATVAPWRVVPRAGHFRLLRDSLAVAEFTRQDRALQAADALNAYDPARLERLEAAAEDSEIVIGELRHYLPTEQQDMADQMGERLRSALAGTAPSPSAELAQMERALHEQAELVTRQEA